MKRYRNNAQIHLIAMFLLSFPVILLSGVNPLSYAAAGTEIQEWLQAHNSYRSQHGAPSVTWSATLAQGAREWADYLRDLQYAHTEETANPAYRMFLGG